MRTFIEPAAIERDLLAGSKPDSSQVREILGQAAERKGLPPREVAVLLNVQEADLWREIFELAMRIKQEVYGRRIVLFAPLYVSNYCQNDCLYCGFRASNSLCVRKALNQAELREEVLRLEEAGHKRLIMVYGEHPAYGMDYITSTIRTAYATKTPDGRGEIRRVNVNAAPLSVDDYRRVKEVGIGTYQVFQETYHPSRYAELHPASTRKGDYHWRLYSLHRAQEAGIDDVGIGALFGLYDWRFEVMGLIHHALDMERQFGVGPHTISFPRLVPAENTPFSVSSPYRVSDENFKRLVAVIRLAVPYTGMILTARERPEIRRNVLLLGVSQIDAGSRIGIGGYGESKVSGAEHIPDREQFQLHDTRSLDEVVRELAEMGFISSFCTACYRLGRTGEHFMQYAKTGFVKNFCMPNAILTFREYLRDYAGPGTAAAGNRLIEKEMADLPEERREAVRRKLDLLDSGAHDQRF